MKKSLILWNVSLKCKATNVENAGSVKLQISMAIRALRNVLKHTV